MHVTLRQLSIFNAVYEHLSTTKAAQILCLSQSAVSSGLADLELQLGVKLFERLGKSLMINENSRLFYPRSKALLDEAQELELMFQRGQSIIHIGASTTIGNYLLPRLIAAFRQQHPQVQFKLTVANSREIADGLVNMAFDIGMIEGTFARAELQATLWQDDEMVWFCAPNSQWLNPKNSYRLSLEDLRHIPMIMREAGSGTRVAVSESLREISPNLTIGMELGNSEAIKHAVIEDLGIGCLSTHVVADDLAKGRLKRLRVPVEDLHRPLWLLSHKQKHISHSLVAFWDFLRLA